MNIVKKLALAVLTLSYLALICSVIPRSAFAAVARCTITGQILDVAGNPVPNVTIEFNSVTIQVVQGNTLQPSIVTSTTDVNGNITPVTLPQGEFVQVTISTGPPYVVLVPTANTATFASLATGVQPSNGGWCNLVDGSNFASIQAALTALGGPGMVCVANTFTAINANFTVGTKQAVVFGAATYVIAAGVQITMGPESTLVGQGVGSTVLSASDAATAIFEVAQSATRVEIGSLRCTRTVNATAGGDCFDGLSHTQKDQVFLHDMVADNQYIGFDLGSVRTGWVRNVYAFNNFSDGFRARGDAISGSVQWEMNDIRSDQNAGNGFTVDVGTLSGVGPFCHNCQATVNTGYGFAINGGNAGVFDSDVFLDRPVASGNGNSNILINWTKNAQIVNPYLEQAGVQSVGRNQATGATHVGYGIEITGNGFTTTPIVIAGGQSNSNSYSGTSIGAGWVQVTGTAFNQNGQGSGLTDAQNAGINVAGGDVSLVGIESRPQGTTKWGLNYSAGTISLGANDFQGVTAGINGLTLTGAVQYLSATGKTLTDQGNFFWDNTNHRLGVGLNNPSVKFQVSESANGVYAGIISNAGGTGNGLNVKSGTTGTPVTVARFQDNAASIVGVDILSDGEMLVTSLTGVTGKAVCVKSTGYLGVCSTVPNASGVCTCG